MGVVVLGSAVGSFRFSAHARAPQTMRVFYACPEGDLREAHILIAMHGLDRAAEEFRNDMAEQALRNRQIVLVPEFDEQQYPDVYAYNFGGVRLPPPSETVYPRHKWNFGIIDRLFNYVCVTLSSKRTTFGMYGNSAGSQYVLRYLALTDAPAVDAAVASNSGVYMVPDFTRDYPVGMGGLDLNDGHLEQYFGRRLTLLVGGADTDTAAPDLPRMDFAMEQGPHRLARGHWYFDHCSRTADRLGLPLAWKLEIIQGAGHISPQIFHRAADILRDV